MLNKPSVAPHDEFEQLDLTLNPESSASNTNTIVDLESELSAFVRWALRKANSGEYSTEKSMKLLERAWKAQKILWRLRKQDVDASNSSGEVLAEDCDRRRQ